MTIDNPIQLFFSSLYRNGFRYTLSESLKYLNKMRVEYYNTYLRNPHYEQLRAPLIHRLNGTTHLSTLKTTTDPLVRFAVIGDVEPAPDPDFGYLAQSVELINTVDEMYGLDFVAGIGDIPRRGTDTHYSKASDVLEPLNPRFYPILGNEELYRETNAIVEFLKHVSLWNKGEFQPDGPKYTQIMSSIKFIFASSTDGGVDFTQDELNWIKGELEGSNELPCVLFIHAAPRDIFKRGNQMSRDNFAPILSDPNLELVISGHSHKNLDVGVGYKTDRWGNHHLHIPAIERTKLGNRHIPRLRFITIYKSGLARVHTFNLKISAFENAHSENFVISSPPSR